MNLLSGYSISGFVFDTVDHSLLLQKLEFYGIREIALEWVKNYITKRY